jgi:hypothetical protein
VSYYRPVGFTPDEEQELLTAQRQVAASSVELTAWTKKQDTIRTITIVSIIGGLLFTMARMGDLVAQMRARRRGVPSGEGGV